MLKVQTRIKNYRSQYWIRIMKMTIGGGEGLETLLVNIALCIVIVIGNQNKNELTLKMNLIRP